MNMNFELRRASYAQLAISHSLQEVERFFGVKRFGINQELVTVLVFRALPVVDLLDFNLRSSSSGKSKLVDHSFSATGKGSNKRIKENSNAETASVNYTVFLQHRKKFRRTLNGSIRLAHDELQTLVELHLLLTSLMGGSCSVTQNGKDCTLHRLADGVESNFYRT